MGRYLESSKADKMYSLSVMNKRNTKERDCLNRLNLFTQIEQKVFDKLMPTV